jgi:hypothetical protein
VTLAPRCAPADRQPAVDLQLVAVLARELLVCLGDQHAHHRLLSPDLSSAGAGIVRDTSRVSGKRRQSQISLRSSSVAIRRAMTAGVGREALR